MCSASIVKCKMCQLLHLMAFLLWFRCHQDLLAWWLNNCLLITRCEIGYYSDNWQMHQCSYFNCMCVLTSMCLCVLVYMTASMCRRRSSVAVGSVSEWHIKVCICLPLSRPLWVINQPEQLWYCWGKERALSSDSSPDTCGFQYDTCIRKAWSNKQCVKFPPCLYQSIKKKKGKKMELNFQHPPPSPPTPPQTLSSRAGISLESELAISTCFNPIKYC